MFTFKNVALRILTIRNIAKAADQVKNDPAEVKRLVGEIFILSANPDISLDQIAGRFVEYFPSMEELDKYKNFFTH